MCMLCYACSSVCESSGANGGTKTDHDGEPYIIIPSYEVLPDDSYLFIPGISGPLLLPSVMSGCCCWVNTQTERQGKKKRERKKPEQFLFLGLLILWRGRCSTR